MVDGDIKINLDNKLLGIIYNILVKKTTTKNKAANKLEQSG